ncbi:hypothetical protein [Streptomyces tubercidicus]|uniref:hypothetical protein n=1 Tax=Streptomyces tubercidicus TaxID=47759 RepID=UPI0036C540A2
MTIQHSVVKADRGVDLYIYFNLPAARFRGVMTRAELLTETPVRPGAIDRADMFGSSVPEKSDREGRWAGSGIDLTVWPAVRDCPPSLLLRCDFLPFAKHIVAGEEDKAKALLGRRPEALPSQARVHLTGHLHMLGMDYFAAEDFAGRVLGMHTREAAEYVKEQVGAPDAVEALQLLAAEITPG